MAGLLSESSRHKQQMCKRQRHDLLAVTYGNRYNTGKRGNCEELQLEGRPMAR